MAARWTLCVDLPYVVARLMTMPKPGGILRVWGDGGAG